MVSKLKTAPASYAPPNANRLRGDLLHSTTARLKAEEAPVREAVLVDGGTVCSDGWDDVERNHLINFLIGNSKGMFFDGTIKLTSTDSEDATHVAKLIGDAIETQGALSIVQVVTDTCSVMKSAWKIIETRFPWITCTCCGPHVLCSLELKDLGKIPEVAKVIESVGKILNRFWGRTRWARTRLREVAEKNHHKKIGLYRAKATRFAGKVREMGRVLRLKADLQEVAISADYAKQKWPKKKAGEKAGEGEEEGEAELDGEGGVKMILLDETGFWTPLVEALKVSSSPAGSRNLSVICPHHWSASVAIIRLLPSEADLPWQIMVPVVKLLRLMDGEKAAMGKVYDRMYMIGQKIEQSDVPWKDKAVKIHNDRW
eukprot:2007111-Prymnesium_polylepis.1